MTLTGDLAAMPPPHQLARFWQRRRGMLAKSKICA
jgi:hypothetical protein